MRYQKKNMLSDVCFIKNMRISEYSPFPNSSRNLLGRELCAFLLHDMKKYDDDRARVTVKSCVYI